MISNLAKLYIPKTIITDWRINVFQAIDTTAGKYYNQYTPKGS